MRKAIYSILFVLILAVSHAAQIRPATNVDVIADVVYGHKDGLALTFDIFKPKARPNGAAVIFIVSGGWVSRYTPPDEAVLRYQELLDKGFTVISLRHGGSPNGLSSLRSRRKHKARGVSPREPHEIDYEPAERARALTN